MKTVFSLMLLLSCAVLFTACPVSTSYPLEKKGAVKMDKALLGEWQTDVEDAEAQRILFKQGEEANTYAVTVLERGSMFMADGDDFTGWLAELGGKRFLVLQQVIDGVAQETYYVYNIEISGNKLVSHDISLKVGGTDAVTSVQAYQEEVLASMKMEDFLASEMIWSKN